MCKKYCGVLIGGRIPEGFLVELEPNAPWDKYDEQWRTRLSMRQLSIQDIRVSNFWANLARDLQRRSESGGV